VTANYNAELPQPLGANKGMTSKAKWRPPNRKIDTPLSYSSNHTSHPQNNFKIQSSARVIQQMKSILHNKLESQWPTSSSDRNIIKLYYYVTRNMASWRCIRQPESIFVYKLYYGCKWHCQMFIQHHFSLRCYSLFLWSTRISSRVEVTKRAYVELTPLV